MDGIEDVIASLAAQRAEVAAFFRGMPGDAVGAPCTESEDPGVAPRSPKDHLAHLVVRERDFVELLERAARGGTDLLDGRGHTPAERDAFVNRENQREVDAAPRRPRGVAVRVRQRRRAAALKTPGNVAGAGRRGSPLRSGLCQREPRAAAPRPAQACARESAGVHHWL